MKYWVILLILFCFGISQVNGYVDSTSIRNPRIAWKLGFVPGLGQLYNGKYLKALGFIGSEYIAITNFNKYNKYNNITLRNSYAWIIFGLYVWNILDAYVDAHLSTFPVKKLQLNSEKDSLGVNIE